MSPTEQAAGTDPALQGVERLALARCARNGERFAVGLSRKGPHWEIRAALLLGDERGAAAARRFEDAKVSLYQSPGYKGCPTAACRAAGGGGTVFPCCGVLVCVDKGAPEGHCPTCKRTTTFSKGDPKEAVTYGLKVGDDV